eukprot:Hpha_TRINITY_DN15062_c0_g1::TRINITY_DN15062_c0_g1_i1::g.124485::m.124485
MSTPMSSQRTVRKKKRTGASPAAAPAPAPVAPPPAAPTHAHEQQVVARVNGHKIALGPTGKLSVRYVDLLHGLPGHVLKYRSGPSHALRGTVLVPDTEGNVGLVAGTYSVVNLLTKKAPGGDLPAAVSGVKVKEEKAPKRPSGYNLYVSTHRKDASGHTLPLGDVAGEWGKLSDEERKEWNKKAENLAPKVKTEPQSEPASQSGAPPAKRRKAANPKAKPSQ